MNKSLVTAQSNLRFWSFLIGLTSLLIIPTTFAQTDFNAMLVSENATISYCGELNYKREARNCIDPNVSDLKRCLELNMIDPLYVYQEEANYSCVNSSYKSGVDIITDELEASESNGGCLAEGLKAFYNDIIANEEFISLSQKFEEGLGAPLMLSYGVDSKDSLFNLQLDISKIEGENSDPVNLYILNYDETGKCNTFSADQVIAQITSEFNRMAINHSNKDVDFIEVEPQEKEIFDSSRFSESYQGAYNGTKPASVEESDVVTR